MIHYLRITLSLFAICAILYVVYYVLTKLPGNNKLNKKNRRIQFIDQMFLNPGVVVYIVKVDAQEFLMGVSNKTINFIHPLKEVPAFSTILQEKEQSKDTVVNEVQGKLIKEKVIRKPKANKESKDGLN